MNKKILINFLCCTIFIPKLRRKIRSSLYSKFCANNMIYLHKENKKVIKNPIYIKGIKVHFQGSNNQIHLYEPICSDDSHIYAYGDSYVSIKKCKMRECEVYINCGSSLRIDENSTLGHTCFNLLNEKLKIIIGSDCMFSGKVTFWGGDGHVITNLDGTVTNFSDGIVIGKHVWIGQDACILKGVEIKDNSIVGARSVVTKKFKTANCIIAGNPARVVKQNINWDRDPLFLYQKLGGENINAKQ